MQSIHRFFHALRPKPLQSQKREHALSEPSVHIQGHVVRGGHDTCIPALPQQVRAWVQLKAVPLEKHTVLQNQDTAGALWERPLYETSWLDEGVRARALHSQYRCIEGQLIRLQDVSEDTPLKVQTEEEGRVFRKMFAYQSAPRLSRIQKVIGGEILIKPCGSYQFESKILDLIPYGGWYTPGCDLNQVNAYWLQMVNTADASITGHLTGVGFWTEQHINPYEGGMLHAFRIWSAPHEGETSIHSLGEDIRRGAFGLVLKWGEHQVGVWKSSGYTYINRSDAIVEITYEA